jgi:SSS family solute:Na+ symporter
VQAYISPPIAAVFLIGILSTRVNARGAMASLLTGFVLGMGRLVAELNKGSLSGPMRWFADINFLHFAVFLFVICSAVLLVVSYTAPAPARAKLDGLTFVSAPEAPASERPSRRTDVILSVLLVLCVAAVWWYFS